MLEDQESLTRPVATVAGAPAGMALGQWTTGLRRIAQTLLAGWLGAAGGHAAAQEQEVPLLQVHRFTILQPPTWGEVKVELAPGPWRVGSPDGPVASVWQLQMALGGLSSIEVGGCCGAWFDGPTTYPCGFTLRGLDLPDLDIDRDQISASPAPAMRARTPVDTLACPRLDTQTDEGSVR